MDEEYIRCTGRTQGGTLCPRNAEPGGSYCWQHYESEPLDIRAQEKRRLDIRYQEKRRLDIRDQEKRRLDIRYQEKRRLDIRDQEKRRLDIRDQEKRRLDIRDQEKRRLDIRDQEKRRLDIRYQEKRRLDTRDQEKRRLDIRAQEKMLPWSERSPEEQFLITDGGPFQADLLRRIGNQERVRELKRRVDQKMRDKGWYHPYNLRRNPLSEVIAYHRSPKKLKSIRLGGSHSGYGAFFSSSPHRFKGKYVYQVKLDLANGLSYEKEPPADISRDISDEIGIDVSGLTVGDLVRSTAEESDAPGAHEPGLLRQHMSKELIAEFFLLRGINYFWDDTSGDMEYMVFDPECISIIERRNSFQYPELNRGIWRTDPRRNPLTPDGWILATVEILTADGTSFWTWDMDEFGIHMVAPGATDSEIEHAAATGIWTAIPEIQSILDSAINTMISLGGVLPGYIIKTTIGDKVTEVEFRENPLTPDGWVTATAEIFTAEGIPLWRWDLDDLDKAREFFALAPEFNTIPQIRGLLDGAINAKIEQRDLHPGDFLIVTIGDDVTRTEFI